MPDQKSDFECQAKLRMSLYALRGADHEKFGELLNMAYSAEKGREVMNAVAFKGYKFIYDAMPGLNGACDYEHKTVKLDSFHRQVELAPTLIHECAHILQVDRLCEKTGAKEAGSFINALNARDFIKLNRAFEADACAHQAAFAYQMKDREPALFEKEMQTPMTQAYAAEMDKSGDEKEAMRASFQAWYGYDYFRDFYDDAHRDEIDFYAQKGKESGRKDLFGKEFPARDVADTCLYKGKPYVSADMLMSDSAFSVLKKDKAGYMKIAADYAKTVGVKADESVWAMAERDKTGKITRPAQHKANAVFAAALKQNGGR